MTQIEARWYLLPRSMKSLPLAVKGDRAHFQKGLCIWQWLLGISFMHERLWNGGSIVLRRVILIMCTFQDHKIGEKHRLRGVQLNSSDIFGRLLLFQSLSRICKTGILLTNTNIQSPTLPDLIAFNTKIIFYDHIMVKHWLWHIGTFSRIKQNVSKHSHIVMRMCHFD